LESRPDARAEAARTMYAMACACYFAATYERAADPGELYRAQLSAARMRAVDLAASARDLAQGFGAGHPGLVWALSGASAAAGVGNIGPEPREVAAMWSGFFAALSDALRGPLPELHGGPWFHLYTVANLHFPEAKGIGRPVAEETPLVFELAFHLRRWAGGTCRDVIQSAQPMPRGKMSAERWQVAVEFLRATLKVRLTAEQVRSRLRGLPAGVGLMAWPHKVRR
jgi:hypothetical protein